MNHRCPRCNWSQTIILPRFVGVIAWLCPCGHPNRVEVGRAPDVLIEQNMALKLKKPPIQNECDHCGKVDYIVLPKKGGDLRWECSCGSVWLMRWRPVGGRRACVKDGRKQIAAPKVNLCGCGLPGCRVCGT